MVKVLAVSALILVIIVGVGWFNQASKQAAPVSQVPPMLVVAPSSQSDAAMTTATGGSHGRQSMTPASPRAMTERSDFLSLVPGDRVLLQGGSSISAPEDYVVAIQSVTNQPGSQLIKGLVEGGGAFIATLGPATLNVFLQSDHGMMRYAGADFKGLLSPLQMNNLDDDIRQRAPPSVTRLESVMSDPLQ